MDEAIRSRMAELLMKGGDQGPATPQQQPGYYDRIVSALEGARDFMGGPPTIGGGLNLAMNALPFGRGMAPGPMGGRMFAAEKGAGSAPQMSVREIDNQIAKALEGTDWHLMDVAGRTPAQLKMIQDRVPPAALELAAQRSAALKAENQAIAGLDKELKGLLKGSGIDIMDVAFRGPEGLAQLQHLIKPNNYQRVLELAGQRAKMVE